MRKMVNPKNGTSLNVAMHVITQNLWEYFLEAPDSDGVCFGYVMGFENELGYVDLESIRPYALSAVKGSGLNDIMPAFDWEWAE
jgi:hypothetical protein